MVLSITKIPKKKIRTTKYILIWLIICHIRTIAFNFSKWKMSINKIFDVIFKRNILVNHTNINNYKVKKKSKKCIDY